MLREPQLIGRTLDELVFKFAGLNHFHWHKVYDLKGNDVTSEIIEAMYNTEDDGTPANINQIPF
jgi:6-phospho-beta-glucosidase